MTDKTNPNYDPPINDPREEGRKHWDALRSELMVTRDALRSSEVDREVMAKTIDDLRADNKRMAEFREQDRNECMALKTSLHIIGRLVLSVLQRGAESRRNGDQYAPPAGGPSVNEENIEAVSKQIEALLAAPTKTNDPPTEQPVQ